MEFNITTVVAILLVSIIATLIAIKLDENTDLHNDDDYMDSIR